jgi:hypothetical protein
MGNTGVDVTGASCELGLAHVQAHNDSPAKGRLMRLPAASGIRQLDGLAYGDFLECGYPPPRHDSAMRKLPYFQATQRATSGQELGGPR